jgi:ferredoxin
LPLAVVKFIESLDLSHNLDTYFFTVPTCGGKPGNCIAQINELLKAKRLSLSYGKMIKMFANAITYYKMADNPQERADESNTEIAVIAAQIAKKKRSDIPKANALLKLLYTKMTAGYPLKAQNFNVSNACIGCGNCEKICPVENVSVHNGKPIFGEQCEQCMACIQWCPARAIDYKNKTQDSVRYHHPEISFAEMAREND